MSTTNTQASNPFSALINQSIAILPTFTLESGVQLREVPVGYKTWGKLNDARDNCLVICHALTGSADVEDWWGPLLGPDRAFDPTRFFIFCGNVIGSPYGTISSVTINPATNRPYGPEMPGSSVKDDVRLHYEVLKQLGVSSVAAVIGGSMGGMTTLEYPLNTPPGFVKAIIPLATSARHSAWCISWGEAQRQSIYSDPDYLDGYYYEIPGSEAVDLTRQPTRGLAAARMAALLTYRSRDSFESRFGRRAGLKSEISKVPKGGVRIMGGKETTDPAEPGEADLGRSPGWKAWREHNDGHRSAMSRRDSGASSRDEREHSAGTSNDENGVNGNDKGGAGGSAGTTQPKVFSAQSYLRYQGDKFTGRFDANCYIHITRKLDTHDLSHPSTDSSFGSLSSALTAPPDTADDLALSRSLENALSLLPPALVIGIESDGLFTTSEQKELAAHIPDAELVVIPSPDGHDGFLLEFQAINGWIDGWLRRKMPSYFETDRVIPLDNYGKEQGGWGVKKESVFGEAEADVTRW
ncbi:putative homoserine O-acetyltransferase [Naematelia encephala]|uniref:Putative homoserine O-acetyltransferase n=1 Tax=Naematelia encephala TaxID=71784 RepID=A0A1Y2BEA9_9TREE|nr:putative homoserine O-acetyltransferase [Naematelia encephala]